MRVSGIAILLRSVTMRSRAAWPRAHAAAHRHPVEQRDHRLRKRMQRVVEPVFVDEEREPAAVGVLRQLLHFAHIAAGAEAFSARALQHERDDAVVAAAMFDQHRELAHHGVRQRIERSRPVQRDDRHAVDDAKQNLAFRFDLRVEGGALHGAHRFVSCTT
ncbi:hypothetical protein GGD41_003773 [Paraburkholderia bryophila]|uniref:Uncharacterized protein n=1 Tax=Paraburkholderia bryophila TaxID=420952 RepID=A0A7Y9WA19_9BURK|nr:hypothetical protein [Paraburkholderia bryophila]